MKTVNMMLNNASTGDLYCLCTHLSVIMNIDWIYVKEPREYYKEMMA
jgi:hypothetical protein